MNIFKSSSLEVQKLPGRGVRKAIGRESKSLSGKMTMGHVRYSGEFGPMEPHNHAEEALYIVDADRGWIRSGDGKEKLGEKVYLEKGMILHVPELEWHVFGFDEGGFIDALFFYGQVDNIRPEEIRKNTR
jgi:gentisate 1,2-dioxygenase